MKTLTKDTAIALLMGGPGSERQVSLVSGNAVLEALKEEGFNLGKFQKVFAFMVKFITPVLIAVVEVFGIIDIIFPKKNGVRAYSSNGLGLGIVAGAIMAICMVIYFTLLRKCETGENADEIELEKKA